MKAELEVLKETSSAELQQALTLVGIDRLALAAISSCVASVELLQAAACSAVEFA